MCERHHLETHQITLIATRKLLININYKKLDLNSVAIKRTIDMIYFTLYPNIWQDTRLTTEQKLIANFFWNWTIKANYSWANTQNIANTFGLDVEDVNEHVTTLLERNYINRLECPEGTCIEFNMSKYE